MGDRLTTERRMALLEKNRAVIDKSKALLKDLVDREVVHRCAFCGHIFFLGHLGDGTLIEAKCHKCHECTVIGTVMSVG